MSWENPRCGATTEHRNKKDVHVARVMARMRVSANDVEIDGPPFAVGLGVGVGVGGELDVWGIDERRLKPAGELPRSIRCPSHSTRYKACLEPSERDSISLKEASGPVLAAMRCHCRSSQTTARRTPRTMRRDPPNRKIDPKVLTESGLLEPNTALVIVLPALMTFVKPISMVESSRCAVVK